MKLRPDSGQTSPSKGQAFHPREITSILVVRLKSLGDVLFTLPSVHTLRESFPRAKIHFLVSEEFAPLLQGFTDVDTVIKLNRSRLRSARPMVVLRELLKLNSALRAPKFSLAVDFQGYGETAFFTWWTRAPERWGTLYRTQRKWAFTRPVQRNSSVHPAEAHLEILRACGLETGRLRNEFHLPARAREEARSFLAENQFDARRPFLFIQPYTSETHKNWPLLNQLEIGRQLRRRGMQVLFGGGPGEKTALEPARQAGFAVSAGVPILVSAGLVEQSAVVLGGDTGLIHLAVALGKRVIMLTAGERPDVYYPLGHPDWSLSPRSGRRVSDVQPFEVNEACSQALSAASA